VWGDFRYPYFWAKIKGGVEKKDDFLKKKRQKVFKKGEKRGKVRKIEKNDAKRCAKLTPPAAGAFGTPLGRRKRENE